MSSALRRKASAPPRGSRADGVRKELEAAIASGAYKAGERLPSERELVELFGVSRLSVREGIKGLIGMGLVEARHGSGYFVTQNIAESYRKAFSGWLSGHLEELIDMLQVRGALTTLAAQRAVRLENAPGIAGVVSTHEAFLDAVHRDADSEEIADLDVRFHRSIAAASGSGLIASLLTDLYDRLQEPRQAIMDLPGQRERSAREHEAIVDAMRARDPDAVARAVDAHISSVCRTLSTYAHDATD